MRTAICFFSGTGNTAFAARELAAALPTEYGVELFDIELPAGQGGPPVPLDHELIGLGAPVHSFDVPVAFDRFLRRLGPGNGRSVFLFVTEGEDIGEPFERAARLIEKRGYRVIGEFVYLLPGNVGLLSEQDGRLDYDFLGWRGQNDRAAMAAVCREQARADAAALVGGTPRRHRGSFRHRLLSRTAGPGFYLGCRLAWLQLRASAACTGCGLCERHCPTRSIQLERGRPRFRPGCTACTRCQQVCPARAIRFAWPMSFLNNRVRYMASGWTPPDHGPSQPV